jgi:predicted NAD-dependent protein-ADP-ribosyltransferase YbiA (DUF1768 family)
MGMDIGSKHGYPSAALSNFSPHPFVLDGVSCNSMEGFLQGLKFKNAEMQKYICTLVGLAAKRAGRNKNWQRTQKLFWQGVEYDRESDEYQALLDRAYESLAGNDSFRRALLVSGDAVLTHEIGRTNPKETVLTRSEFCGRLMRLRARIKK